jgi:hypothetical protein
MGPLQKSLLLSLSVVTFVATSCNSESRQTAELRAAEVPVHPLVHGATDFVAANPEQFPSQVAVLWLQGDEGPLGIIHSLREMGIPFFLTRDLDRALRHKLVVIGPTVDGRSFTDDQARKVIAYVNQGGSVVGFNVFAEAFKPLFGFRDYAASKKRYRAKFKAKADPIDRYLTRPEELEAPLGSTKYSEIFWTNGYVSDGLSTALASFEDGSSALLAKKSGSGSAYLFGLSLQDVVLRNQINHDYDAERHYANVFEPGSDIWMLLLRGWYESKDPAAVRLGTIPDGKDSVFLLSHDVDWENSFDPALEFAAMEEKYHVKSTFFIQTKFASDANSVGFFFGKDLEDLKKLYAAGSSIGSHSIIHSRGFNKFQLGAGTETFGKYQPRGTGFDTATGATVFGEVRVSKQLLDGNLPGQQTVFFRAGHLRVPPSLPEALQRCGYLFDSSFTAGDVLTNFPYAAPLDFGFQEDSGIYEFPILLEDGEEPALEKRVGPALEGIRANAEIGAFSAILIHPNEAGGKLQAEEAILKQLPAGVVAGDMLGYARFWRARDRLKWSVAEGKSGETRLNVTADEPVAGITFEFQKRVAAVSGGATVSPDQHRVILPSLKSGESVSFDVRYAH